MHQRVIKIILPDKLKDTALELLKTQEKIQFWLEESNSSNTVISVLTDYGLTESIMDIFERKFGKEEEFKLIVFPVEASIPRPIEEKPEKEKPKNKKLSRISREELYADIVGSTKTTKIYITFVVLSTIVAAVGLLHNNVAVIIGTECSPCPFYNTWR